MIVDEELKAKTAVVLSRDDSVALVTVAEKFVTNWLTGGSVVIFRRDEADDKPSVNLFWLGTNLVENETLKSFQICEFELNNRDGFCVVLLRFTQNS